MLEQAKNSRIITVSNFFIRKLSKLVLYLGSRLLATIERAKRLR